MRHPLTPPGSRQWLPHSQADSPAPEEKDRFPDGLSRPVLTMTLGGRKPSASQATASRPFSASQSRSSKASPRVQCELCRSPPVGQAVTRAAAAACQGPSEGRGAELASHALEVLQALEGAGG